MSGEAPARPAMTPALREVWEAGVTECAVLLSRNLPMVYRERIEALSLGLLHGTLGTGRRPAP